VVANNTEATSCRLLDLIWVTTQGLPFTGFDKQITSSLEQFDFIVDRTRVYIPGPPSPRKMLCPATSTVGCPSSSLVKYQAGAADPRLPYANYQDASPIPGRPPKKAKVSSVAQNDARPWVRRYPATSLYTVVPTPSTRNLGVSRPRQSLARPDTSISISV
jgi:hypothetical protein